MEVNSLDLCVSLWCVEYGWLYFTSWIRNYLRIDYYLSILHILRLCLHKHTNLYIYIFLIDYSYGTTYSCSIIPLTSSLQLYKYLIYFVSYQHSYVVFLNCYFADLLSHSVMVFCCNGLFFIFLVSILWTSLFFPYGLSFTTRVVIIRCQLKFVLEYPFSVCGYNF